MDLKIFWDQNHNLPSPDNHEGAFSGLGSHMIKPFGKSHFTQEFMYFGLFSQSGININIGCSTKTDNFACISLSDTVKNKGKPKIKKKYKQLVVNADNSEYLIEKLMARGPPSKRGEFSQAIKVGIKTVVHEEFVMD